MNLPLIDWSLLRIIIGLIIINIIISIIVSFSKPKVTNIFIIIFSFFITAYSIAQAGFYNYFGTFMSFATSSQAKAVGSFVADFINSFKPQYWLLLIPFILLIIYYIFIERQLNIIISNNEINYLDKIKGKKAKAEYLDNQKKQNSKNLRIITFISFILIIVLTILYGATLTLPFMQNKLQMIPNKVLFKNPTMPNIAVGQFGVEGFGFIDLKTILFADDEPDTVLAETSDSNDSSDTTDNYTRVIDDTAWNEVNDSETDKDYQTLNSYFISKDITSKNDYTGIFEGKNLIVIMMESGSNVITDYPEYFPNINKLYNEGWSWTNSFSPRNACSTGNNEMTGLTSLYTINRNCTANIYKDNTYYEAMFNLFNNQGYYTSSYHDYTDHFYYRHTIHPNMGSQKFYGANDLNITLGDTYQPWPSDVEFIEKSTPNYLNKNKYMTWLTTVSSHMTYAKSSVTGDMYLDLFNNESWDTSAKRYMSKLKILDNAVGELLNELTAAGKLDDTVIALYADHYPYGLATSSFQSLAKYDVSENGDIDRTPFIIYNPELTPTKYNEYTSYINILPTIANLFNLNYDPRLYGGIDLLSSEYPNVVAFADGSWCSDIAYYDATSGSINYTSDATYTNDEIIAINNSISNEISMDNLAIKKDYFTYLNKKLNIGFVPVSNDYVEEDITDETAE
jgi:phosphoglycerol transferase MdoB-like AlkP superfamily enzyme